MPLIAVRQSAVASLSPNRRAVLALVDRRLRLGDPLSVTFAGIQWWLWDDWRYSLLHVAIAVAAVGHASSIPEDYDPSTKTRAEVEADVRAWLSGKVILPGSIDYSSSADHWKTTADAQGTNLATAREQMPAGAVVANPGP